MPTPTYDEAYKALFGDDEENHSPTGDNAPPTPSADAVRKVDPQTREMDAFLKQVNPIPMAKQAIKHPLDTAKAVSGYSLFNQGVDEFKAGNHAEGFRKMFAGSMPIAGPMVEGMTSDLGEKIGEGDYAGAAGSVAGQVFNAGMMKGAGGQAAGLAEQPLVAGGRRLYQSANIPNKWFRDLPKEVQNRALDKGLEYGMTGLKPTQAGVDAAEAEASKLTNQIDDIAYTQHATERLPMDQVDQAADISQNPSYTMSVNPGDKRAMAGANKLYKDIKFNSASLNEIEDAKQAIADKLNVHAMLTMQPGSSPPVPLEVKDIPDSAVKAIQYPSTMTVKDFMDLKRAAREGYTTPTGRLMISTAADSIADNIAQAANKTMIEAYPELKDAGLNAQDWLNLKKVLREAAGKAANRSIGGITVAAAPVVIAERGVQAVAPMGKAALLASVVRSPAVRTALASALYKSGRFSGTLGDVLGRASGLAAMLDDANDKEVRQYQSINAQE